VIASASAFAAPRGTSALPVKLTISGSRIPPPWTLPLPSRYGRLSVMPKLVSPPLSAVKITMVSSRIESSVPGSPSGSSSVSRIMPSDSSIFCTIAA
jgi:hypothetical protein